MNPFRNHLSAPPIALVALASTPRRVLPLAVCSVVIGTISCAGSVPVPRETLTVASSRTSLLALAQPDTLTLDADADTLVRTDVDARRNDNYGCEGGMQLGTGRGGGGIPWGGPDAMRSFIRFSMPSVSATSVVHAELQVTIADFNQGTGSSVFLANVHRVVDSGPLTPWVEGNGTTADPPAAGCVNVDAASGMAWQGIDANNQTQPNVDPAIAASTTAVQGIQHRGDLLRWDVTSLVRSWLDGTLSNYGLMLRDPSSDGTFRELYLASRERGAPLYGPRLVLTVAPTFRCAGFEAPFNGVPLRVKKQSTIPLKAILVDKSGHEVTSRTVIAPPSLQVLFTPPTGGGPVDVTAEAVAKGHGTTDAHFAFTTEGKWQFNLSTSAYRTAGLYQVILNTGDAGEYGVEPVCQGSFTIE
jgi:hypothetical protein